MEKLSKRKLERFRLRMGRPTRNEHVFKELFSLKVNEVLQVPSVEWKNRTPPYWSVNKVAQNRGLDWQFACKRQLDGQGWLITRIK